MDSKILPRQIPWIEMDHLQFLKQVVVSKYAPSMCVSLSNNKLQYLILAIVPTIYF
jgi:hypothetical protein